MTDTVVIGRHELQLLHGLARLTDDVSEDESNARDHARWLIEGPPVEEDLVVAAKRWPNNAHLIADVARLGYLDGRVIDVTFGIHGGFWKVWTPDDLTAHDLRHGDGVDFRQLPHPIATFDAGVIDGPYKLNGTDTDEMAERFGVDQRATTAERHVLICDGIRELGRVIKPKGFMLVKGQDQICNGQFYSQQDIFTRAAEDAGMTKVGVFYLIGHSRPQPMEGRTQRSAHGSPSFLMVFRKDIDDRVQPLFGDDS